MIFDFGDDVVVQIVTLAPSENVRVDADRLSGLYAQLGESGAEDVVCRAIEELAVRLSHCQAHWQETNLDELHKCARSLVGIADQIGMTALATVARDVTGRIEAGDATGLSATLFRLIRIGERSLTAVWDLQDLSG